MSGKHFGQLIREARRNARVTLQEAAELLGVSTVYVSEVELSKRPPFSIDRIRKLAKFYKVPDQPLISVAISQRGFFELQGSSPSLVQLRALSGMARGELTETQWEQISKIVERGGQLDDE
jgi:transcriptional regulator with XRE-family HTH domain